MLPLERKTHKLRSLIDDADAVIVGIGSGMSSAAGFNHYNRTGMARAGMANWQQAFGFKSLFEGFYHLYPSLEQQWAYYARYIDFMLREPASRPYLDPRALIGHEDYFILRTNLRTSCSGLRDRSENMRRRKISSMKRFMAVPPRMASFPFRLGCRRKFASSRGRHQQRLHLAPLLYSPSEHAIRLLVAY